ncbi:MAG TPA: hypothetical protein VK826_12665 [Bacteroidia bacterium]|nr:hypothetical protein [Bacteroidia bacterium]
MNETLARWINMYALRSVRRSFNPYTTIEGAQDDALLVSGIFRSGTSITTYLLTHAGFDAGPEHHLLQAHGKYAKYNPDGFLENYFFMDFSRYLFHITHAAGDRPPKAEDVAKIKPEDLDDDAFRSYTLLVLRDSRVSNRNKADALKKVSVHHLRAYLSHAFGKRPVIKNPHFSVLEGFFSKVFPESMRVVVFRRQDDWMRSAKDVTPHVSLDLYDQYYRDYLDSSSEKFIFFNYDKLLADPAYSIRKLMEAVKADRYDHDSLVKLVRNPSPEKPPFEKATEIYHQLVLRAVNL